MTIDPLNTMPLRGPTKAFAEGAARMKPREAAQAFEAFLTQIMIKEMRKTVPEGLFSSSAMELFSDVLDEEIATRISQQGRMGFADMIESSISHVVPEAAPSALGPGGHELAGALPVEGRLTSRFGERSDPFERTRRFHHGVDIAAPRGASIRAVEGGVVTAAGRRSGYGNVVIVKHPDGLETLYAHCDTVDVKVGQRVDADQTIATVGDTGRATGPHLHFEVRKDGQAVDPRLVYPDLE